MTPEAQRIEALLFLAGEAVSRAELGRLTDLSLEQVEHGLAVIAEHLAGHGITLTSTTTHVQLTTAPGVSGFLKQYVEQDDGDLSAAAAETLALIAYRGPIRRTELDAIRGVDSSRMVKQLLARGLVRKQAAAERIPQYVITEAFLEQLGVTTADELPQYKMLSNEERIVELLKKSN